MSRIVGATIASACLLALAPGAGAAPGGGAPTFTGTFNCDGQTLTFIVEGSPGVFSNAYILETGQFFIPTSFTFNGTTASSHPTPVPVEEVSCTADLGGGLSLTVTGYFVPPTG